MARCYQLVGVPASGKTTWIQNQTWMDHCVLVSTDHYVDKFASRLGKTYSEVFDLVMPRAIRLMMRRVQWAREQGLDVIWDQTSTTRASRARKFRALPDHDHVAVVFDTPPAEVLSKRLAQRPGKVIPHAVVSNMIENFEMPEINEGFVEIWRT